ncbi:hypothetical protein [Williamsia soli]|uniref:hypothetical protein n=1 Tax=Williamsia soli TaxID=364929 RepID=UPI001F2B4981|nr:hypothetical protein [Williamsia soli]
MVLEVAALVSSWAVFAVVGGIGAYVATRRDRKGRTSLLIKRRVVVNLKSGTAVAGVIVGDDPERLTLKGVEVIEPGATAPTPADGEILIDRDHVDYIQAP